MTVNDVERVRSVARRITESSSAGVRADIERMLAERDKPEWVHQASRALEVRYDTVRATRRGATVYEAAPAGVGADVAGRAMGVDEMPPGILAEEAPSIGVDETIVLAVGTPVFLVKNNSVDIDSARTEAAEWRKILTDNAATVNRLMASVGRIDADNFSASYLGTAWVIDDGLVVTNRHVANLFAASSGTAFTFRLGFDARNPIGVSVDFLEEFGNTAADEVVVDRVVWVAPDNGPDIAFLKLADGHGAAGRVKLELSTEVAHPKLPVAVIGYPTRDDRFSDQELAKKIFGGVFDKKRLAAGTLLGVGGDLVTHSCCTLGGNSGSPVVDIGTGKVVGLHYRGIEFIENEAVPAAMLRRYLKRGKELLTTNRESVSMADNIAAGTGGGVTITIPLKITVELDASGLQQGVAAAAAAGSTSSTQAAAINGEAGRTPDRDQVFEAVRKARAMFATRGDVVAVKPGYRFVNGIITDERAVVVSVRRKVDPDALQAQGIARLPQYVDGVRVDVAIASTRDLAADVEDEAATPTWHTNYQPRPDLPLKRRKAEMGFVIHSSPDAGWPQLGPFLKKTRKSLAVAMYDFGARNVVAGVLDAVKATKETIAMVLQVGGKVHAEDMSDAQAVDAIRNEKGAKFSFAPASVGKNGIFDSAYHIKVAVRDSASMWLSSGNWQISNQPDVDPLTNPEDARTALGRYNREWHAILDDEVLAQLFEAHILRDLEDAKAVPEAALPEEIFVFLPADLETDTLEAVRQKPQYFEPLIGDRRIDVQPILTPDNYIEQVLPFLQSATTSIHFQNQSFNTHTVGDEYKKLLDALVEKQQAGLDVKIIFRSFDPGDDRDMISDARDYGFINVESTIRRQKNCHTKGIIVDGEAVLLGSHNWTTAGTGFNRDASLIFYDREITQFYERLFKYDWDRVGPFKIDESVPAPMIVMPRDEMAPPPGYVAVPLSMILGRDATIVSMAGQT
jgi:hypothetical protein